VFAGLGDAVRTRQYLRYLEDMPSDHSSDVRCLLAVVRAKQLQGEADEEGARRALAEAIAISREPGTDRLLPPRFWWMAAELSSVHGQWEQAFRLLEHHRRLDVERRHDVAAVRRIAAQYQTDASARAVEAAQRDQLTGLGNRERLVAVGDGWVKRGLAPLVAVLNLRRFNDINEALGREMGDAVLLAVAARLREVCNGFEHAIAARVYADQLALVVANVNGELQQLADVAADVFGTPLDVAGDGVDIHAAWGVAHSPAHGTSMHKLMGHAEIALKEARRGNAGLTVYSPGLERADPRQLNLISELKRAAKHNEFTLLMQPKFRLVDDVVVSFEALIRWDHPSRGRVPPKDFVPFAERTGSIRGITEWVLGEAMRCSRRLREAGLASQIAVNVSVHDLATPGFRDHLVSLLAQTGARADDIRLELTESAVMRDPGTAIRFMRDINTLGFEWSIDDFGTGQSSLAYLHMLPVSELKIDGSFVRGANDSRTMLTLLKAAIDLGTNLGLSTVGEGAETAEDWALLRQLGCSVAQGWHGAHPMAEGDLVAWLRKRAN
jgi:diguanylate cyclase (GGDEF)-like protein